MNLVHLYLCKYFKTHAIQTNTKESKGQKQELSLPLMSSKTPSGIEPKTEILFKTIQSYKQKQSLILHSHFHFSKILSTIIKNK